MYPTYVARRAPSQGCRFARHAPQLSRQLSGGPGFFPQAHFLGVLAGRQQPFFAGGRGRDVFDHFDEYINRSIDTAFAPFGDRRARGSSEHFTWQPRFDVSEVDNVYQLRGELPGVEAQDLDVQFTDANTLVISGKTETKRTEGAPTEGQQDNPIDLAAAADNAENAAAKDDDTASVHSDASSYVQPTVEDEADATARENGSTTAGAPTPNTTDSVAAQEQSSKQAEAEQRKPHYYVSERSVGSFQRTFTFPDRVNTEGVTASLKNGILDLAVPKAQAPEAKKITIQ